MFLAVIRALLFILKTHHSLLPFSLSLTLPLSLWRASRVSGHVQGQRVLQLQPVTDSHPEQLGRHHAIVPYGPAQRPAAAHRKGSWLRQPVAEERRRLPRHQPGLGRLRSPGGAIREQVQRQRLARRAHRPQPAAGRIKLGNVVASLSLIISHSRLTGSQVAR